MNERILCVDDDPNLLAGLQRNLRRKFPVDIATSGAAALQALERQGPYAVLVADMRMPGMDGVQLLEAVMLRSPDTIRVMLTGNADQQTAKDAVNRGHIFRFLTKPCSAEDLEDTLRAALERHRLAAAERTILEETLNGSAHLLSDVLSLWDPALFGLGQSLREQMRILSEGWQNVPLWELELAAMLAPVGYVTVPRDVLQRFRSGASLSPAEAQVIRRAPEIGAKLISNIPRLENVARMVRFQEKHFDGGGFPKDPIAGRDIPIGSRILKVLIDMLQLEARGSWRWQALALMRTRTGVYDPTVLDAAFQRFEVGSGECPSAPSQAVGVPLRSLSVGDVLAQRIESPEGLIIAGSGTFVTPLLLERLWNFKESTGLVEPLYIRVTAGGPNSGPGPRTPSPEPSSDPTLAGLNNARLTAGGGPGL